MVVVKYKPTYIDFRRNDGGFLFIKILQISLDASDYGWL